MRGKSEEARENEKTTNHEKKPRQPGMSMHATRDACLVACSGAYTRQGTNPWEPERAAVGVQEETRLFPVLPAQASVCLGSE